ncbi:MAG: FIST N-terminal domain-containing protein [Pseudomonadota bacterium]
MHIAAATYEGPITRSALDCLSQDVRAKLGGAPDLLVVAYTVHHDAPTLQAGLISAFPDTALLGSSTCRGVISNAGAVGFGAPAVGVFAVRNPDWAFGAAHAVQVSEDCVDALTATLIRRAQADADRVGEVPDLVWLHARPGIEERVIAAIRAQLGSEVLISGGSSADETIEGNWSAFGADGVAGMGIGLALFFCDAMVTHHFENGYVPTGHSGIATRADGRRLIEIDGRPAAEVYNSWTGGLIAPAVNDPARSILGEATWAPLGKVQGQIRTDSKAWIDYFCLVHPASVGPEGELMLFADVAEGTHLTLMSGTRENLTVRPASVANAALTRHVEAGHSADGALMVFCAGCMLALGDDIGPAADYVRAAYGDTPFLTVFTFGEQGSFVNGERQHGNLMISSSVFGG